MTWLWTRAAEKKVKDGFAEQNEHDGDPDGSSEKTQFDIGHLDCIQCE
jgi:hypothetical protein